MANFKKNDEAVSAVIGVILMVAITVILAAVIAAFVFQLGGSTPKAKNIGVELKRVNSNVFSVKTMSGTDIATLEHGVDGTTNTPTYTATVAGVAAQFSDATGSTHVDDGTNTANTIGSVAYFYAASLPSGIDLTVVAHFSDGTEYAVWSGPLA